jgi:outer membrane lipoprotein-sorting protein
VVYCYKTSLANWVDHLYIPAMRFLKRPLYFLLLSACVFLSLSVFDWAFAKKKDLVDEVLNKYKSAKLVKLDVRKKVKSDFLGKEQIFVGKIFVSQKRFRWDTETPDKSQLIYDGDMIWNVQYPPKEFKSVPNVAKMKVDKNSKKQLLLSLLLNNEPLSKNFKVLSPTQSEGIINVNLEPKNSELSIKTLTVKIESKKKEITAISYTDDIGNVTDIEISKAVFGGTPDSKLFIFKIPHGATVTNL